jgi:predicted nucleic-acid-binding protein
MKAVDTNILIRFLTKDDEKQSEKVRIMFENAEKTGQTFLICTSVVLELIWVLKSVYELSDDDVKMTLEKLLQFPVLEFENGALISKIIGHHEKHIPDISDLLIGLNALVCGCEKTITFDKKASSSQLFEML